MDFGMNDDGTSQFDIGLGPGFFDPNAGNNGGAFAPQPVTYGPDPGFNVGGAPFDPSGGVKIPGTGSIPSNGGATLDGSGDNGAGGGGGSDFVTQLLHSLGIGGSGGSSGLSQLLAALGIGAGAVLNHNASKQGAQDIQNAVGNANNAATSIFAKQGALYQPYYDAGASAMNRLAAQAPSNLAANFSPLGTGRGIRLGSLTGH